ncbi:nicotinamide-nucleotide adenylyltransferase [Saccharomycopsis crataegensis]|uniref:Nicotinamide-nucleotide adenylyltransferase n=1 Tax=Saccharomycopsis crataegensis TaxID=43959 RepID=A0AAV5QXS6_9ASCO|nr:nicotinamide-nucleotide adenylyltransferase [Saccharomycopsis crataegensis]
MPIIKNYQSIIDEFTKNSSKIKFISHLAAKSLAISNTSDDYNKHNVLFLDSSFNPPHKGHISIIENAINHYQKKVCSGSPNLNTIVLSLSVNNADKIHPKPESFDKRLQMIDLLSKDLYKINGENVSVLICLTKLAKFTDKYEELKKYLSLPDSGDDIVVKSLKKLQEADRLNLAFLLGFDTLIRIFDSKYYKPKTIDESLNEFIQGSELVCLARDNGNDDILSQEAYIESIKSGEIDGVPKHWASRIVILNPIKDENSKFLTTVSSSEIRNSLGRYYGNEGKNEDIDEFLSKRTIPSIKDCILKNKYYDN